MRARGEYTGGRVPYGFRLGVDGKLVGVPEEQATIAAARAIDARAEGGLSLAKISARLAAGGMFARNGPRFWPAQIAAMLKARADAA
jgi:hypothetical protein